MNLFCFGLGYCADYLSTKFIKKGWQVSATCRSSEKAAVLDASEAVRRLGREHWRFAWALTQSMMAGPII